MSFSVSLYRLKCRIQGCGKEIRALRHHARRGKFRGKQIDGETKMWIHELADEVGTEVRILNLFYGFLRDRSPEEIEAPTTRKRFCMHQVDRVLEQIRTAPETRTTFKKAIQTWDADIYRRTLSGQRELAVI